MAGFGEGQFVFARASCRDGFVERRLQKPEIRAVRESEISAPRSALTVSTSASSRAARAASSRIARL